MNTCSPVEEKKKTAALRLLLTSKGEFTKGDSKAMKSRKINDSRLITLKNEGRLQKDIAKILGVSEPAITKRLNRLFPERYEPPKSLEVLTDKEKRFAIERAGGRTATEAALNAFECSSRNSAKVIGSAVNGKTGSAGSHQRSYGDEGNRP